jgi:hypothetical protein
MRPPGLKPTSILQALRGAEAPLFHGDFLQCDFWRGDYFHGNLFTPRFRPWFSSDFHKEVSPSTVSAQAGNVFLLRLATFEMRVGSAKTWHSQSLPTDDCGDAGGRLAILEGELPGEIRRRA